MTKLYGPGDDLMKDTIKSLTEYIEQVSALNDKFLGNGHCSVYELLYRGHSDLKYELLPSIARGKTFSSLVTLFDGERNLIEMAKNKVPEVFKDDMKPIELLALLQHYGIPTRLLDITENALVALYFSCCNHPGVDGEVFVFANSDNHVDNPPIINAVADTYRLTRGCEYSLDHFFKAAFNQPYFIEQKHIFEICNDLSAPDWIEDCCSNNIWFVHVTTHVLRQQLQQGRYILFPNEIVGEGDDKAFDTIIKPLDKGHTCIAQKFIIDGNSKETILRDLRSCGISKSTLFCDSIDLVCKGIVDKAKKML